MILLQPLASLRNPLKDLSTTYLKVLVIQLILIS